MSPTGHCTAGRHERCAYRPGGACESGIWMPEGYVTVVGKRKDFGDLKTARFPDGSTAMIVRPSHRYFCPCDCHPTGRAGQLELFSEVS